MSRIVLAWIAIAFAVIGAGPTRALTSSELQSELDTLVGLGAPGVIAYLKRRDEAIFASAGVADLATGRPPLRDDKWRIASVTKIVTAAIVLKLVHDNLLELDARLGKVLPGVLPRADRITIRQLLNHTSGIPDYAADPADPLQISAERLRQSLAAPRSVKDQIDAARKGEWPRPWTGEHLYSNTNYVLLGLVLERLTGTSFGEVVETYVLRPLQLANTGFPDAQGKLPEPHLRGYVAGDGPQGPFADQSRLVDVTEHTYFLGADGGLYSSVDDLSKLLDALWSYRIVADRVFQQMFRRMVPDHDGFYRYGEGVMAVTLECGKKVFGHEGRDLGIATQVFVNRDNSVQFILAVNTAFDAVPDLEAAIYALQTKVFCDKGL